MLIPSTLKSLLNKNTVIGLLILIAIATISDAYKSRQEVRELQAVYQNPKTVEIIKIVKEKGPVQIRTIIVEKPSGEKITTVREDHGASLEQLISGASSQPVPVSEIMPPARTDRWLLGLSLLDFSPRVASSYTLWGGYSFRNRFDLLYGLNANDGLHQSVLGIVRF